MVEEFSNLYIFHLRGNQRTSGERSRKEGGKIFGSGSRAPIAISILVKNPESAQHGNIRFYDIGDYLSREQKLEIVSELGSIASITEEKAWQTIEPDSFGDWLNQRDPNFDNYISLGDKRDKTAVTVFENYSLGLATNRDAWVYNFSKKRLSFNINKCIDFFNQERSRFNQEKEKSSNININNFVKNDTDCISWTVNLKHELKNNRQSTYNSSNFRLALYRPFTTTNIYFDSFWIERTLQIPRIFPTSDSENLVISVTGRGSTKEFSALITNVIPDLEMISKGQCFPLYLYEATTPDTGLFSDHVAETGYQRKDAINNEALDHFQKAYPQANISKEDIFYYIYGLLHSEEYREKYADNLAKQLPRIPLAKNYNAFVSFSEAGRKLAALHLNYETVDLFTKANLLTALKGVSLSANGIIGGSDTEFYVTKMKFGKMKDPVTGKNVDDKTKIIYNNNITVEGIPEEAYDYVVNGKPALEWVMERQAATEDKKSGIVNDANDWANETMNNAKYPLELLLRVINVSLQTQKIVRFLPNLDILND